MAKTRLIGEGAEAKVYASRLFGESVIVKYRQEKRYRERELDAALRESRTKKEARLIFKAMKLGINVPRLVAVGKYTIIMSKVEGLPLKDLEVSGGVFSEIGAILAKMHNGDIVHGDFTPANIMYSEKKGRVSVIDFGLGDFTSSIEAKALDLLLMKRSITRRAYAALESSYAKNYGRSGQVIERLKEIEMRGRYQTRSLMVE